MSRNKQCKDIDYVQCIQAGGSAENKAIECLIHASRAQIENYIVRHKGTREEAEDIFMEGIVETIHKIRSGEFRGESGVTTFLFSVCKFIWYNELRKKGVRQKYLDTLWDEKYVDLQLENRIMNENQRQIILDLFAQIQQNCREIFNMRFDGYPFEEIAEALGKSRDAAMMEASRCRSKLKKLIKKQANVRQVIEEVFERELTYEK